MTTVPTARERDPLDAVLAELDPASAAEVAAEALREVNRLTIGPLSPGLAGWEYVGGLYRVLGELHVLAERLPQALRQLAHQLEQPAGDSAYRSDSANCEPAEALVAAATGALAAAREAAMAVETNLGSAQSAVAHLPPDLPKVDRRLWCDSEPAAGYGFSHTLSA